jgi:CRP/FNR family transcriptional regulator, anaerobic regulatory protein
MVNSPNNSTDAILANISKHIQLNQQEIDTFISILKPMHVKKNELVLKSGQLCTTFNYVNSGALRAFYKDPSEKESTIMFAIADWWITDMPCFISGAPSLINIEAISESSILQLSKKDLDQLYIETPKFERFFRILMQNAYIREQLRILQTLSLPAEVRYNNFAEKYPSIIKQVPLKNIASYLGITPEFLSTIRAKNRKRRIS